MVCPGDAFVFQVVGRETVCGIQRHLQIAVALEWLSCWRICLSFRFGMKLTAAAGS